jgi:electron transport complex protein RnfC
MTGKTVWDESLVVTPYLSSIMVFEKEDVVQQPCMGCGKCSTACPAYLVPTEIKCAYENKDFKELKKLHTLDCVQCGLCSYVCPSRVEITDYVGKAKEELKKHNSLKMKDKEAKNG